MLRSEFFDLAGVGQSQTLSDLSVMRYRELRGDIFLGDEQCKRNVEAITSWTLAVLYLLFGKMSFTGRERTKPV